jgi:hypothetical protein
MDKKDIDFEKELEDALDIESEYISDDDMADMEEDEDNLYDAA